MGPVPGREALEAMKRTDIQKLCKDCGVKANLKTEALIDLLLDASRPLPSRSNPARPPERSTSRVPSHPGIRRGSVIIHNASDDIAEEGISRPVEEVKPTLPSPRQPPRTRKAKDTQYRLGVGRPAVAGGSGARAITKSVSVSRKFRRGKSNTSVKPSEATITEEPELERTPRSPSKRYANKDDSGATTNSGLQSRSLASNELLQSAVAEALAPVKKELDFQKTQLVELRDKVSSMIASFETHIRELTSEIRDLRAKAVGTTADTRDAGLSARIPHPPSTPKRVWTPPRSYFAFSEKGGPSELLSDSSDPRAHAHPEAGCGLNVKPAQVGALLPGFAQSTLGKRARDSASEEDTEVHGSASSAETELEIRIGRSASKRAKSHTDDGEDVQFAQQRKSRPLPCVEEAEEVDKPELVIKTSPELHCGPSPPPMSILGASSDQSESQNAFDLSFLPATSTPTYVAFPPSMGMFPLPQRPTSPSPANNAEGFGSSTLPQANSRSSGSRGVSGDSQTHVEASGSAGVRRVPSSNDIATGLGLTVIKTSAADPGSPAPPAKRTMYGTELEADTRFGDFGVEGVASGFWAKSRF
ncbi:hypothetical protein EDD16DRAFT_1530319 [Pisolithus croceorrhizus]|nr:hypothetical protein EDD16DRAFT_1530319 [Pisolithus croceorrhizus]KAI6136750.1 hypothetical protein F5141DRAFT_1076439 [Pisolithus sp. B1]KAI6162303.1 hypothetical protein EDD17DRAFT_1581014 [Pisolithus thermaeus]